MKAMLIFLLLSTTFLRAQKQMVELDSSINKKMREFGVVGLATAVIVDSSAVWSNAYGYADKEKKIPYSVNTIQNIASVSKSLVGACIMRAVQDKQLSLDEDINTYLPFKVMNPYYPEEKITLRHLAVHTSGITDRSSVYDSSYYYGGDAPQPLGAFLKNYFDPAGKYYSKENFLDAKPGSREEYSNIGAALAGYILECATGEKLNIYSKRIFFKPLGMTNTGWLLKDINVKRHAKLYKKTSDSLISIPLYGLTTYPDGGCRSTVSDLAKFLVCILRGGVGENGRPVLKEQSVKELLHPNFTEQNKPAGANLSVYNIGLFWEMQGEGAVLLGHHGADPGMRTYMFYNMVEHTGIILFMNTQLESASRDKFSAIYEDLWKFAKDLRNGLHEP